ncbi:LuxR C-terminal-related transcriptional regulator [Lentzea sp. NPDC058450]|uniref:LuxR C-terminal-related transcriptional regulator n=1 Tax=Lentzea sp. NPDC058450 TaxID=3346505 RepID=UPI003662DEA1
MYSGQKNCEPHSGCVRKHEPHDLVGCLMLSSTQARILEGVAAGFSSGRLSRELYLSSKTIDYHVRVLSDKLQAPNRVALISRAFVLEILRTDSWPPRVACETVD